MRVNIFLLLLLFLFPSDLWAIGKVATEDEIKAEINLMKNDNTSSEVKANIAYLENALLFIEQTKKQKNETAVLENKIKSAPDNLKKIQENIKQLTLELEKENFDKNFLNKITKGKNDENIEINELEKKQIELQQNIQKIQNNIGIINAELLEFHRSFEQGQKFLIEMNQRTQEILQQKYASDNDLLKIKLDAELDYLNVRKNYFIILERDNGILIKLNETQKEELFLQQKLNQIELSALQTFLSEKRLKELEIANKKVEGDLAEKNEENSELIKKELELNNELTKFLLSQTQKMNNLSQDNLRVKDVLDNLAQTQHNIEEQISALQGTLILSRIINQQKQSLPKDQLIQGLSKDIADLRVDIFEFSQKRDAIYNEEDYISNIEQISKTNLNKNEKETLTNILIERKSLLTEIIKSLNNQLNISINIELNQKQVVSIIDLLQEKLQQQSFWVKSNNPINLEWVESFPKLALAEISEVMKYVGFEKLDQNLAPTTVFILFLLLIYLLINWKKNVIKNRLRFINNQVNTLKNDSQWYTPEALFWTIVLALPSTLLFVSISSIIIYLFFYDPIEGWIWVIQLSSYWLLIATILSLLRPNGLAHTHFGLPSTSNEIFQRIVKQSVSIIVLLIISSIFSKIEIIGFTNDVIGQVMTIIALALCLTVIRPLLDRAIIEYEDEKVENRVKSGLSLFKIVRLVLIFAPITLIVLIVLGYYYTAVYLIEHLLNSYFIILIWIFGRYFAYRFLTISSRRMAYRRLQNKRQKIKEREQESFQLNNKDDASNQELPENNIKISTVNQQIFSMADLVGWVVLFTSFYSIWSDLISIAYYLDGFILWEQIETTAKGTEIESITLLNLMRAILNLVITYVLVKNIAGILEVTFFSRVKLSKGTPHTITAVLTYAIVTAGSVSAFTSLGVSWNKIQWIFTALSVGLGFGVREIFGSFVSGSILLFERPIRLGDKVSVGSYTGIISKIRLRSTTLLDSDNREIVLPNQAFVTDRFINWTLNNTITRISVPISVSYDADLKLVRQLLLQVASEAPKAMESPKSDVNFLQFGHHGLEHELLVYVPELDDRTSTINFLHYRINQLFNQHHIKFAFNQLDVHIYNEQNVNKNKDKKCQEIA